MNWTKTQLKMAVKDFRTVSIHIVTEVIDYIVIRVFSKAIFYLSRQTTNRNVRKMKV